MSKKQYLITYKTKIKQRYIHIIIAKDHLEFGNKLNDLLKDESIDKRTVKFPSDVPYHSTFNNGHISICLDELNL